jgi:amino acid permease
MYPAHIIIENYLYSNWAKTKRRQWTKNFSRTCLVAFSIFFTLLLQQKISKFLGILGAVACTPIAFTLPAAFHLKAIASTTM